jgi:hypothetical protein
VGYNDEIGWDYNGDGKLTNPGDDVSQWEKGAWLCIQSEGLGPYWMPYREIQENMFGVNANGGECGCDYMLLCRPKKDYSPQLTFKISVSHNQRQNLKLETGVANGLDASEPEHLKDYSWAFNNTGGPFPMAGDLQSETIEIGLDLTDLTQHVSGDEVTFFLKTTSSGGSCKINSLSLMDYTSGSENEISCEESGVSISGERLMAVSFTGDISSINSRKPLAVNSRAGALISISPNPARLRTGAVRFTLAKNDAKPVLLYIRDIAGRTVYSTSLMQNNKQQTTVSWNLKDMQGKRVPSGAYIAALTYSDKHDADGLKTRTFVVAE